ncbi:MAG: hypothetical protein Q9159_003372 [Coniocarpon cinnabarinum]
MTETHTAFNDEVLTSIRASLTNEPRRPLLHYLNGDSSWLLQLPRRPLSQPSNRSQSQWYNILIDPWLTGDHIDYYKWFSQHWHAHDPAYPDIQSIERLIEKVENLTVDSTNNNKDQVDGQVTQGGSEGDAGHGSQIDIVLISFEFTDHCHQKTLLQIDPRVPVFATTNAASLVKSWDHFESVIEVPLFFPAGLKDSEKGTDWRLRSHPLLPQWLSLTRFVTGPFNVGDLHSALFIAFDCSDSVDGVGEDRKKSDTVAEGIIYTPHGIAPSHLESLGSADPPIDFLALFHGTNVVRIAGGLVNLGAKNGLELQQKLRARHWFRTHDGENEGKGLVAKTLTCKDYPVAQARDEYCKEHGLAELIDPPFKEMRNGNDKMK